MNIFWFAILCITNQCSAELDQNSANLRTMIIFLEGLVSELNENLQAGVNFYHPSKICPKTCLEDDQCTSVFWSNSSNSECRIISDNTVDVEFIPGEFYLCKDCKSTVELVDKGVRNGVIQLGNVAAEKNIHSSNPNKETILYSASKGEIPQHWSSINLQKEYMVAAIGIVVNDIENRKNKGNLKVCLVKEFEETLNPCNKSSEILNIQPSQQNSSFENFKTEKIIMGKYVIVQLLNDDDTLEIKGIQVQAVIPTVSYQCVHCSSLPNTHCDQSEFTSTCKCDANFIPIGGEATKGCRDPCENFKDWNNICIPQDSGSYTCQCKEDFYAVYKGDPCGGCQDPCDNFMDKNNICIAEDSGTRKCECNDGFYAEYKDDPCSGCKDPCDNFMDKNNICIAEDSGTRKCECNNGFYAEYKNDPCSGCKVIPSGYKNFRSFGWMKVYQEEEEVARWEAARTVCLNEGADLFIPGPNLPIVPEGLELPYRYFFWVGVRRGSDQKSPYKRISSQDQSVLEDESTLWNSYSGEPTRRKGAECVYYHSHFKLLSDIDCTDTFAFICQIFVSE